MDPAILALIVLVRGIVLPAVGIVAGGILLARTATGRRLIDYGLGHGERSADLREMQARLEELQYQLDDTQERLDAAERMLAAPRRQARDRGPQQAEPVTPV